MSSISSIKSHFLLELGDYFAIMKPKILMLVTITGFTGLMLAPSNIHPVIGFIAILCISLSSGAASAINMWYDVDIDSLMERTRLRPTVRGTVKPSEALAFGIVLGSITILIAATCVNVLFASILLFAIIFYGFIYTILLKRSTPQNIVIGGAAGAFPPVAGWAAVTNSVSVESILLFLIIFMWTPPHFWALSIYKNNDYIKAGIPMMPCVKGIRSTKLQILFYTIGMVIVSILPFYFGFSGIFYLLTASTFGGVFIFYALRLFKEESNKTAPKLFGFSILYLFVIFVTLVVDKIMIN